MRPQQSLPPSDQLLLLLLLLICVVIAVLLLWLLLLFRFSCGKSQKVLRRACWASVTLASTSTDCARKQGCRSEFARTTPVVLRGVYSRPRRWLQQLLLLLLLPRRRRRRCLIIY